MNEGDNIIVQHIRIFRSLPNQLAGVKANIDNGDANAILLNIMPSSFNHSVFTLNEMNPSLETIISSLIDERSKAKDCPLIARKKSNISNSTLR